MTTATVDGAIPGMTTARRGRGLVVSALGIMQILAWGSSYYLPAVLAKPISEATGWTYGWVIGGLSCGLLVSALVATRVGRTIDHYGGRPVLALSAILLASGLALLAAASNMVLYISAWLVLGLGMAAGLYDAAFATLGRLYGRGARSAITSLTLWGGFASTVCWPLSAFLVEQVGWRVTCVAYAVLQLSVSLPLSLFLIPREAHHGVESDPAAASDPIAPVATLAHRGAVFALLAAILTTGGAIAAIVSVHLITIIQASGITLAAAVGLGVLVGPAQVGARVIEMLGGGRHHPIWTLIASVVLVATGLALLWSELPVLAVALISYGAGNGIWSIARGTLPLALFGASGYAHLMGRLAMPSLIAQAVAPALGAVLMVQLGAPATLGVLLLLSLLNLAGVTGLALIVQDSIAAAPNRGM